MIPMSKRLRAGAVAVLILAGIATVAGGQVPSGGSSFGGSGRGMLLIKGSVICADCSLDEAQKAQPAARKLYQLSYNRGQVVMKVSEVNESAMFDALAWPPRLWVRGSDSLLQRLGAEQNLFKEMTVTGILHNTRTLEVFDVTVEG